MPPRRLLIAASETPDERQARRDRAGKSSGETYRATLLEIAPGAQIDLVSPSDEDAEPGDPETLSGYDGVFLTGSPLHVYQDTPEVARQLAWMRALFRSGTPSFGSCAGLQIATAAAGGRVRPIPRRTESALARRITRTEAGRDHPLLAGRAPAWDALVIHGDEVERLPPDSTLLATSAATRVQAAEIRHDGGVFWGVQYHPELALGEIASALRADAATVLENGLADDPDAVERQAALLDRLHRAPEDLAARWALGVDDEVALEPRRRLELTNFLQTQVRART